MLADVVWPAAYIAGGLVFSWAVLVGLVLEWPFAKWLTGYSWWAAWKPTLAMNLASAILGGFLIAVAGIVWEVFPGTLIHRAMNVGTFNPITWWATFVMAVLINSLVEAQVLKRFFGVLKWWRAAGWLTIANSLSVTAAAVAIRSDLIGFRSR
jgi:hypothetical protein